MASCFLYSSLNQSDVEQKLQSVINPAHPQLNVTHLTGICYSIQHEK